MTDEKWIIREQDEETVARIRAEHGLPDPVARLLCNRGITEKDRIRKFLENDLAENLHDPFLLEEKAIGCNASLLRVERSELADASLLPEGADSVTVFVNPRAVDRTQLTACISFDSGRTWTHTRLIHAGRCAYSSLAFNAQKQRFVLLYEQGVHDPYDIGITAATFDLEWLLCQ